MRYVIGAMMKTTTTDWQRGPQLPAQAVDEDSGPASGYVRWIQARGRLRLSARINLSQEFEKVKRTLEEYFSVKVEHRDTSLKGWNWGKATVQSKLELLLFS